MQYPEVFPSSLQCPGWLDQKHNTNYFIATKLCFVLECLLDKKFTRYQPESSVPEERVIAIRISSTKRSARAGVPWSPAVADFYMEMYPEMVEYGYSLNDIIRMFDGEFET